MSSSRTPPESRRPARGPSRIASIVVFPQSLRDWLEAVLETAGLTSIRDPAEARRMLLEDSLRGSWRRARARPAPIVDVGSGGARRGSRSRLRFPIGKVTLVEAERAEG